MQVFERSANPRGKLFLQDGDPPSQNSKKSKKALEEIGARKFSIPARKKRFENQILIKIVHLLFYYFLFVSNVLCRIRNHATFLLKIKI